MNFAILPIGSALLLLGAAAEASLPPVCPSQIYCHGPLLHHVQMSQIYADSKSFVDMKLKNNATITLSKFDSLMESTDSNPSVKDILRFVEDNFEPAGSEFEKWKPSDWRNSPKFLKSIKDDNLRNWAGKLNSLWKFLGRKMKDDVKNNPELYSIIYVPHAVIVPGGRFREFYYWDSYWIVRGLLLSEMHDTVKGMLSNFLSIVDRYGMIPNGGRCYYTQRSQPPLFIPMFYSYLEKTDDTAFLAQSIDTLEKEFKYWMNNHTAKVTVGGNSYRLAVYRDGSLGPRPESYREDIDSAKSIKGEEGKNNFYSQLKSAAESGWDFSTRWFIARDGSNLGSLVNIDIKSIVPVDLNAILYWNAKILSGFYEKFARGDKAKEYGDIADEWRTAVEKVLWDDDVGSWLDYDMKNKKKRNYFYASNFAPLWTGCYEESKKDKYISKILKYSDKINLKDFEGGIPTSFIESGEQWDYPNAWPPLQHIVIAGLEMTGDDRAKEVAYEWANKWVRVNYAGYKTTNAMWEKYDATVSGHAGVGGEYDVQLGFGWTNGVIMELLHMYGDRLKTAASHSTCFQPSSLLLIVAFLLPWTLKLLS